MWFKLFTLALDFIKGTDLNEKNFTFKTIWVIILALGSSLGYFIYLALDDWIGEYGETRLHELKLQEDILAIKEEQIVKLDGKVDSLNREVTHLLSQKHALELKNLKCNLDLETAVINLENKSARSTVITERLNSCLTTYHTSKN